MNSKNDSMLIDEWHYKNISRKQIFIAIIPVSVFHIYAKSLLEIIWICLASEGLNHNF